MAIHEPPGRVSAFGYLQTRYLRLVDRHARCGKNVRVRNRDVPRTFPSLSGTHTIRRNYHSCEECKEGFYPRDEFLGLPKEGEVSVELEKRQADFLVNDVFETAEVRLNFHCPHLKASAN